MSFSRNLFDDIQKALDTLGFKVKSATINSDIHYPGTYNLSIEAVGPFNKPAVPAKPATPKVSVCECGYHLLQSENQ
jgi:signal recognition particle subunit SEC65